MTYIPGGGGGNSTLVPIPDTTQLDTWADLTHGVSACVMSGTTVSLEGDITYNNLFIVGEDRRNSILELKNGTSLLGDDVVFQDLYIKISVDTLPDTGSTARPDSIIQPGARCKFINCIIELVGTRTAGKSGVYIFGGHSHATTGFSGGDDVIVDGIVFYNFQDPRVGLYLNGYYDGTDLNIGGNSVTIKNISFDYVLSAVNFAYGVDPYMYFILSCSGADFELNNIRPASSGFIYSSLANDGAIHITSYDPTDYTNNLPMSNKIKNIKEIETYLCLGGNSLVENFATTYSLTSLYVSGCMSDDQKITIKDCSFYKFYVINSKNIHMINSEGRFYLNNGLSTTFSSNLRIENCRLNSFDGPEFDSNIVAINSRLDDITFSFSDSKFINCNLSDVCLGISGTSSPYVCDNNVLKNCTINGYLKVSASNNLIEKCVLDMDLLMYRHYNDPTTANENNNFKNCVFTEDIRYSITSSAGGTSGIVRNNIFDGCVIGGRVWFILTNAAYAECYNIYKDCHFTYTSYRPLYLNSKDQVLGCEFREPLDIVLPATGIDTLEDVYFQDCVFKEGLSITNEVTTTSRTITDIVFDDCIVKDDGTGSTGNVTITAQSTGAATADITNIRFINGLNVEGDFDLVVNSTSTGTAEISNNEIYYASVLRDFSYTISGGGGTETLDYNTFKSCIADAYTAMFGVNDVTANNIEF